MQFSTINIHCQAGKAFFRVLDEVQEDLRGKVYQQYTKQLPYIMLIDRLRTVRAKMMPYGEEKAGDFLKREPPAFKNVQSLGMLLKSTGSPAVISSTQRILLKDLRICCWPMAFASR